MSQYQNTVAFQAPSDFATEQANVDRQRKMAELLLAKSQQPGPQGQMIGNTYVAPSWTQSLSQALNGPLGQFKMNKADEKAKDVATRQRQAYADELGQFSKLANGEAERTIAPMTPNDDEGNINAPAIKPAVGPDKKAALAYALGAQNPALQKYGMDQMMPKDAKWEKVELPNPDGSKKVGFVNVASPDPISTFQSGGVAPVKNEFVNGQGVNPYTSTPTGTAIPKQLSPDSVVTMGPNGTLIPNAPVIGAKSQIAAAGKSSNNTTVINQGPKEFEKELGQLDAKQLGKYRDQAEIGQATIGTVQALRAAEKQGAFSGGGANAKLAVTNLINGITGAEPKGLVGSQIYNAEASKLVLDRVKALGTNPSNADRDFIGKTVPQLSTSATARQRLADYMEKKATEQIDLYKRADSHARKNHGLGGFDQFAQPTAPGVDQSAIDAEIARRAGAK